MALSTTVLFCVGLYDDFRGLGPLGKVSAQVVCGMLLFWFGFRFHVFVGLGPLAPVIELLLTLFWVLIISNSFNLVDGIDGLAAGTALVSSIIIFFVAIFVGESAVATAAAVLGGALAGFLWFNSHPASIFMGDCGSLFVGGLLAVLSLALTRSLEPGFVSLAVPMMCCGFPLFETLLSVTRRVTNGRDPFKADREHIHHRLLDMGLGQRKAAWILHVLSVVCALCVFMLLSRVWILQVLALVIPALAFSWLAISLQYHRPVGLRAAWPHYLGVLNDDLRRATDLSAIASSLKSAFSNSDFDGFELLTTLESQGESSNREGPFYAWFRKDGNPSAHEGRWNLALMLGTRKWPDLGYLVVYREHQRGPVEADLHRVLQDVRRLVSSAIERILRQSAPKYELGQDYAMSLNEHSIPEMRRTGGPLEEKAEEF